MISISICMIPIFKNEINMAINALNIKGNILSANSIMYAIKPILISVFNKTKEIEKTLLGKAYQEKNI